MTRLEFCIAVKNKLFGTRFNPGELAKADLAYNKLNLNRATQADVDACAEKLIAERKARSLKWGNGNAR